MDLLIFFVHISECFLLYEYISTIEIRFYLHNLDVCLFKEKKKRCLSFSPIKNLKHGIPAFTDMFSTPTALPLALFLFLLAQVYSY